MRGRSCGKVGVLAFDMDGVLIVEKSSWSVLHEYFGSKAIVDEAGDAQRFERGEITYSEWMRRDTEAMVRVAGRCVTRDEILNALLSRVTVRGSARTVVELAKDYGIVTAVVSGGVHVLAEYVAEELGIDLVFANRLAFDEGGCLMPGGEEVVNPLRKGDVLRRISKVTGVPLSKFMYVGDSAWDVSAFRYVGYPVFLKGSEDPPGLDGLIVINDLSELITLLKELCGER